MDETNVISKKAAADVLAAVARDAFTLADSFQLVLDALSEADKRIKELPPEHLDISKEYAKAVRNWLVLYQVKCAELQGRYTPYEVLGWIVSDWSKENEIW